DPKLAHTLNRTESTTMKTKLTPPTLTLFGTWLTNTSRLRSPYRFPPPLADWFDRTGSADRAEDGYDRTGSANLS
ncbi:hypothetical protein M1B34_26890, partial [Pseudomonas sp. MAFF 302030]|nr:hypothetical protein [Pseudomonas morbosilactucae]